MDKEVIGTIFSLLVALVGIIRWLMQVNFKQNKTIEDLRTETYAKAIEKLESITDNHTKIIGDFMLKIKEREAAELEIIDRLNKVQAAYEGSSQEMQHFVKDTKQRLAFTESKVVELGKDLFMIKGKRQ